MCEKVNGSNCESQEKPTPHRLILIVDDEPTNAEIAEGTFERMENVKTISFTDPTEAKAYLEANKVDVLITDLQMPEVTGLELAALAQAKGVGKVVVMSGAIADDESLKTRIAELEAVALPKPFRVEQLKKIVTE